MVKNDLKYLSQDFGSKLLDLLQQKGYYLYDYSMILKSLDKNYQSSKSFIVFFTGKKNSDKEYEHVFKVCNYHDVYFKYDVLSLADVFEKFRSSTLKNCGFC